MSHGVASIEALLVLIGRPRLKRLGHEFHAPYGVVSHPEMSLYEELAKHDGNAAHSRYNGLIRLLVSYERSLELELRQSSTRRPA